MVAGRTDPSGSARARSSSRGTAALRVLAPATYSDWHVERAAAPAVAAGAAIGVVALVSETG
ncbi:MAG: hypothetical protein QOI71_3157 [Gaiellales bacterium]|nr:hypothetical protein [Gaiellales bacterium]